MQTLSFSTSIKASPETVWFVLWNDELYRKWTAVFSQDSYAVSTWQPGSRIHFLGPDGKGMYADIEEMKAPHSMRFRHLGELKDFEEMPPSNEWKNALEAYTLQAKEEGTHLLVTIETVEAYAPQMNELFPKALALVKSFSENFQIHISAHILADVETVWHYYTQPEHVTKWNQASDDWHTPFAEVDLQVGGQFTQRMEAKDGSMGFDFKGTYDVVQPFSQIVYHLEDGRKVSIEFSETETGTQIQLAFDPEFENSFELQYAGWSAILDSFRNYTESLPE